jgi:asparaginyl-tRNA synthetase
MFGAIMRVRSVLSYAVHSYFRKRFCVCEYANYHGSDAEGAGEMFKVTALPFDGTPRTERRKSKLQRRFLWKRNKSTVSGQLEGETL